MDRITKALARAKEQRQFSPKPPAANVEHLEDSLFAGAMQVDVPQDFMRKMKIIVGSESTADADAYKLLRTRVIRVMEEKGWVTLGITSPTPRVGKSLTAINLGIAIARNPQYSVLLVDADLRNPSIHRLFGINVERGLVEYLASEASVEDFLLVPSIDRLVILPTAHSTRHSSELLTSPRMQGLLDGYRKQAKSLIVIVDLPPLLLGDDAIAVSSRLDAVLMVVEDGVTKTSELTQALGLIQHVHILGTVLNKCRAQQSKGYEYYS